MMHYMSTYFSVLLAWEHFSWFGFGSLVPFEGHPHAATYNILDRGERTTLWQQFWETASCRDNSYTIIGNTVFNFTFEYVQIWTVPKVIEEVVPSVCSIAIKCIFLCLEGTVSTLKS